MNRVRLHRVVLAGRDNNGGIDQGSGLVSHRSRQALHGHSITKCPVKIARHERPAHSFQGNAIAFSLLAGNTQKQREEMPTPSAHAAQSQLGCNRPSVARPALPCRSEARALRLFEKSSSSANLSSQRDIRRPEKVPNWPTRSRCIVETVGALKAFRRQDTTAFSGGMDAIVSAAICCSRAAATGPILRYATSPDFPATPEPTDRRERCTQHLADGPLAFDHQVTLGHGLRQQARRFAQHKSSLEDHPFGCSVCAQPAGQAPLARYQGSVFIVIFLPSRGSPKAATKLSGRLR